MKVMYGERVVCRSYDYSAPYEAPGTALVAYASNPWYPAAPAKLGDLSYTAAVASGERLVGPTALTLSKGTRVGSVTALPEYEVSFSIKPKKSRSGWSSILHFSKG